MSHWLPLLHPAPTAPTPPTHPTPPYTAFTPIHSVVVWDVQSQQPLRGLQAQKKSAGMTRVVTFANNDDNLFITGGELVLSVLPMYYQCTTNVLPMLPVPPILPMLSKFPMPPIISALPAISVTCISVAM